MGPYNVEKSIEQENIKRSDRKGRFVADKCDLSHFKPTVHEQIQFWVNIHHADIQVARTGLWKSAKWQSGDCVTPVTNRIHKNSHPVKQNQELLNRGKLRSAKKCSPYYWPQKSYMLPISTCISSLPIVLNSVGNLQIRSSETQK